MLKREEITRERIESIIAEIRKQGPFEALTHEERETNRRNFLKQHSQKDDLWIFGYGSLIWNPAFYFEEQQPARLYGFHRSFCLHLTIGRGSHEKPGLMLALDRGGSCSGIAFRIAADKVESETEILWMREMMSGAYIPRLINLKMKNKTARGLVFVINRKHSRYMGNLDMDKTAEMIANGAGILGTCREYLENTVRDLDKINVKDRYLHKLLCITQKTEKL